MDLLDSTIAQVAAPTIRRELGGSYAVIEWVTAAGIGAVFFALAGGHGQHVPVYLHAAEWTALATVVLLAASFAVAFRLPRRARS